MNYKMLVYYCTLIYGIGVTLFLIDVFFPDFLESSPSLKTVFKSFFNWRDDPTAFCFSYFIGYGIIWLRQLSGALIILGACVLFYFFNRHNQEFHVIFIFPALLVGLFYASYYFLVKMKQLK